MYRWEDCSWAGINNARLRKLPSLVPPFVPFLISREYNYGRRQLARPFLKIVSLSLSLSLSNQPRGKYSWEIRRRAVDRRRHEEFRLVPGRRFGQSKRQNLKTRQTLWNNDPSHPRLRASPANRGVFNTAWSLGKLRVYANVLSCLLAVCKSLSCKLTRTYASPWMRGHYALFLFFLFFSPEKQNPPAIISFYPRSTSRNRGCPFEEEPRLTSASIFPKCEKMYISKQRYRFRGYLNDETIDNYWWKDFFFFEMDGDKSRMSDWKRNTFLENI